MPQSAAIQEKLRQFEQNSKPNITNSNGNRLYNKGNLTTSNGQLDKLASSTMVQNLKNSFQKPQRNDEADYLTMHRADLIDEVKTARGLIEENRVSYCLFDAERKTLDVLFQIETCESQPLLDFFFSNQVIYFSSGSL